MAKPDQAQDAKPAASPPAMRFNWAVRVSPHILVLLLTLLAAILPLRGAIVSGVHWWWDHSYAKVDYVMDEAEPNAGYPYIAGHLAGDTEQYNLVGLMKDGRIVVMALPEEAFAPGKHIAIWHSPDAPNFVVFGDEVNDIPVASLPARPGLPMFLAYLAWLAATWVIGIGLMAWVAARWSRTYGNAQMRYREGTKLRM
ncbi:MAG: hypothetical protein ABI593_07450 [Betaproteobacteria bacterium]